MSEENHKRQFDPITNSHWIGMSIIVVGLILICVHIWYENTTRSEHWIEELKTENVCERIDIAISWGDHPFTEKMVKFAEQRKQELKCP